VPDLQRGITPTSNEHPERGKAGEDRFDDHEPILLTWRNVESARLGISVQAIDLKTRSNFGYEHGLTSISTYQSYDDLDVQSPSRALLLPVNKQSQYISPQITSIAIKSTTVLFHHRLEA
jgi:hypothetical protein